MTLMSGSVPEGRSLHGAALVDDGMFVFGGVTANGRLLNDLWMFNLTRSTWHLASDNRQVDDRGAAPLRAVGMVRRC